MSQYHNYYRNNIHNAVYERREGTVTPQQADEIIYEPVNTDVVLRI